MYGLTIRLIVSGRISFPDLRKIIICITIILFFAYPAFSYDYFNYLFTAKTVAVYGQNPYLVRPIDFTGIEPWTLFMRWTHLTSAYSPLWILFTVPFYLIGLNYFILTLFSFKIIFAGFYLLAVGMVYRSLMITDTKKAVLGTAIFALNPLVLIESVVSPHNDIMMAALAVLAYYIYLHNQRLAAFFMLSLSVAVKTMTIFLLPAVFFRWNRKAALFLMTFAVLAGFARKELLPWYFLWVMPFVGLALPSTEILLIYTFASFGLLMRYAPYLYAGDYEGSVNLWRNAAFFGPTAGILIYILFKKILSKIFPKT
jgi:hypothetical protein